MNQAEKQLVARAVAAFDRAGDEGQREILKLLERETMPVSYRVMGRDQATAMAAAGAKATRRHRRIRPASATLRMPRRTMHRRQADAALEAPAKQLLAPSTQLPRTLSSPTSADPAISARFFERWDEAVQSLTTRREQAAEAAQSPSSATRSSFRAAAPAPQAGTSPAAHQDDASTSAEPARPSLPSLRTSMLAGVRWMRKRLGRTHA